VKITVSIEITGGTPDQRALLGAAFDTAKRRAVDAGMDTFAERLITQLPK